MDPGDLKNTEVLRMENEKKGKEDEVKFTNKIKLSSS